MGHGWDADRLREFHWIAWRDTMANQGISITHEQFLSSFGQRNDSILPRWLGASATAERTDKIANAKELIQKLLRSRVGLSVGVGAFILTTSLVVASKRASEREAAAASDRVSQHPLLIAGPGRVEPASEDIKIGSELSGRLKIANVEEGDVIHRGEVLAELENADYRAQVDSARANVMAKDAVLRKVINGARRQERNEAWSSVNEARAVLENAESELRRRQELYAASVVSREELECYARG
jgi:multidrug efflux pump subunit AcrA (membrane-fusion protein)